MFGHLLAAWTTVGTFRQPLVYLGKGWKVTNFLFGNGLATLGDCWQQVLAISTTFLHCWQLRADVAVVGIYKKITYICIFVETHTLCKSINNSLSVLLVSPLTGGDDSRPFSWQPLMQQSSFFISQQIIQMSTYMFVLLVVCRGENEHATGGFRDWCFWNPPFKGSLSS